MGYGLRRTAFDRSSYAYISGQLGVASVYDDSTTNQTLSFPLPYKFTPTATVNSTGLTITADTTSVTITAPDNTTAYNGVVQFVGI